ncbi:hypothetical protein E2C01_034858 [Portunus trituberculatus]|uniref:Uncharacterized protein n=1 Tax=Portunus trituberculatus TaxID=210409 RepID=A0A5B7F1N3_PORTR|nr:hypothetical protein [Portunus trituberculatus]
MVSEGRKYPKLLDGDIHERIEGENVLHFGN